MGQPHINPLGAQLRQRAGVNGADSTGAARSVRARSGIVVPLPVEPPQRTWSASTDLYSYITERGFFFPREMVTRYLMALKTKPFVLFSGIPGTGKTKLALLTAEYFAHTPGTRAFRMERPQDSESVFYLKLDTTTLRSGMLEPRREQLDYFNVPPGDNGTITCNITNILGASGDMTFRVSNLVYGGRKHLTLNVPVSVRKACENTGVTENDYLKFEIAEEFKRFNVSLFRPERQQVEELPQNRYTFVSVRPSWNDHTALLGEYDERLERYLRTPVLELLLRAHREEQEARLLDRKPAPYFIVLDEMNIAKIEHYFSDFLSVLESRRYDADGTIRQETLNLHNADALDMTWHDEQGVEYEVPQRLPIPTNVLITGTVNDDSSTYALSPKVLDRATTMMFSSVDFDAFLGLAEDDMAGSPFEVPAPDTRTFRLGDLELASQGEAQGVRHLLQPLLLVNEVLTPVDMHFGYRVLSDMALYLRHVQDTIGTSDEVLDVAVDVQILEHVLPRLFTLAHGYRNVLASLLAFCTTGQLPEHAPDAGELLRTLEIDSTDRAFLEDGTPARYPRSAGRLHRMLASREAA